MFFYENITIIETHPDNLVVYKFNRPDTDLREVRMYPDGDFESNHYWIEVYADGSNEPASKERMHTNDVRDRLVELGCLAKREVLQG
jgi:hypothetical protein